MLALSVCRTSLGRRRAENRARAPPAEQTRYLLEMIPSSSVPPYSLLLRVLSHSRPRATSSTGTGESIISEFRDSHNLGSLFNVRSVGAANSKTRDGGSGTAYVHRWRGRQKRARKFGTRLINSGDGRRFICLSDRTTDRRGV